MDRLFVFHCRDGEHGSVLRERVLEEHRAYIENHADHYAIAGRLRKDGEVVGSLLVVKAKDQAAARAKFEADPYFTGGVWQAIRCEELDPIGGEWFGAVDWGN